MIDLRKALASDLTGRSLASNPISESALDRIWALAFSDELGRKLWRLKLAHDAAQYKPVIALLAQRIRSKRHAQGLPLLLRLCEVVVREWLGDKCVPCGGRGAIVAPGTPHTRHTCTVCNGSGLARHSDLARMRAMGFSREVYAKWEGRFATVHQMIADADVQAYRDVAKQLERWRGEENHGLPMLSARRGAKLRAIDGGASERAPQHDPVSATAAG